MAYSVLTLSLMWFIMWLSQMWLKTMRLIQLQF